jgi:hypothetical protein
LDSATTSAQYQLGRQTIHRRRLSPGKYSVFTGERPTFAVQSIDVNKLIKGKPLDNIEFMQWLKSYHDRVTAGTGVLEYDGEHRRMQSKTGPKRPSTSVAAKTPTATSR